MILIKQRFGEVSRSHGPSTEESSVQFPNRLPSPDRTGKKDKDSDRIIGIWRGWVDEVNDNSFYCAIL